MNGEQPNQPGELIWQVLQEIDRIPTVARLLRLRLGIVVNQTSAISQYAVEVVWPTISIESTEQSNLTQLLDVLEHDRVRMLVHRETLVRPTEPVPVVDIAARFAVTIGHTERHPCIRIIPIDNAHELRNSDRRVHHLVTQLSAEEHLVKTRRDWVSLWQPRNRRGKAVAKQHEIVSAFHSTRHRGELRTRVILVHRQLFVHVETRDIRYALFPMLLNNDCAGPRVLLQIS